MLRGYRCIVVAAFGWLTLSAVAPNNRSNDKADKSAADVTVALNRIADAETKQADSGEYQTPCRDGEYNNRSDLCAQWYAARAARDAADWAYWAVFLGILSFALSGVGLCALLVTIRQGRDGLTKATEANDISRDAQRAWVSITAEPTLVRRYGIDGLYVRVNFIARNSGQTQATHFSLEHKLFFLGQTQKDMGEVIAEQVRTWMKEHDARRISVLLPNDSANASIWESFADDDIGWWQMGIGPKSAHPVLVAAVFYRTLAKPDIVQVSWRSWYLNSIDEKGQIASWIPWPEDDLGPTDLCVEPFHLNMAHQEYEPGKEP